MYANMLSPHAHLTCWLCELYFECGSNISKVIYVKYVAWMMPVTLYEAFIFAYISPYIHAEYLAYVPYMPNDYISIIAVMEWNAVILVICDDMLA